MTPTEYKSILSRIGLSQVGAGHLFGSNPRTSRRWASGEQDVPLAVAILLRLIARKKVTIEEVERAKR